MPRLTVTLVPSVEVQCLVQTTQHRAQPSRSSICASLMVFKILTSRVSWLDTIPFQHHGVKLPNFAHCNRPPGAAFKFFRLADTGFLRQQAAAHDDASLRLRCTWHSQFFQKSTDDPRASARHTQTEHLCKSADSSRTNHLQPGSTAQ
ncbi:hypothetical protein D9619_005183 [Psilocybe cf. subviscida]|uniref:Uncharacterized protein n=1 Tax=Psilocybe cf. subviscida TaxID=2480587 RepID=A0A8H5FBH7_9AGAR|nr:hypothetical protein D9619_005183 [Psilocybe cf. subviscida]